MWHLKSNIYHFEIIRHFEFILLAGELGLHFGICVVHDSEKHVEEDEEEEEDEENKVGGAKHTIGQDKVVEFEISQQDSKLRETRKDFEK